MNLAISQRQLTSSGIALLPALLLCLCLAPRLRAAEIAPFQTFDQSPLVQIYGLPAPGQSRVLPKGEIETRLTLDLANNFAHAATLNESVMLDGESLRSTVSVRRGFPGGYQLGLELPVISQSGGYFDGFIEGWHGFFGLPNGTRAEEPKNRLLYQYEKDGRTRLSYTEGHTGIGDLRLTGGTQLYSGDAGAVALHGLVKFPTGDSSDLTGSGSTDFAVWATGSRDYQLERWGKTAFFGSLGGLAKTEGDVLRGQQRTVVWYGTLGAGWSPLDSLALKLQFSSHTPFYKGSDLVQVDAISTLLTLGGTIAFTGKTALDIGVSEDVAVERSPDVTFHLGLASRF